VGWSTCACEAAVGCAGSAPGNMRGKRPCCLMLMLCVQNVKEAVAKNVFCFSAEEGRGGGEGNKEVCTRSRLLQRTVLVARR